MLHPARGLVYQGELRPSLIKENIMATSLAEIRAKLQAQSKTNQRDATTNQDTSIYPHWNIPENSSVRIRFLPDGNDKNSFFWVERLTIKLPFAGVKGQPDSKPVIVQVPCVEMWGDACPILTEVRNWYKDESLKETANKYWKKRSYLFQGFVRDNPLGDDKAPENPIRRFVINPQIFKLIKDSLMDPDLDNIPTDFDGGLDFNIKKTPNGQWSDYGTSSWSRKESSLSEFERNAIEQYGLFNLSDFLPKRPNAEELDIIKEMFEASVDGEAYDLERWGKFYKPYGLSAKEDEFETSSTTQSVTASATTPAPTPLSVVKKDPPFEADDNTEVVSVKPSSQKAEDILAMIRSRQKQ